MATKKRHELDAADRNAMSGSTFAFPRVRKETESATSCRGTPARPRRVSRRLRRR